jgi:serine/threonine protein kinase
VPVFFVAIDLAMTYFLHGAGQIRHMLLMAWGGDSIKRLELSAKMEDEIRRSKKEIRSLRVLHGDLCPENLLWNPELQRILIIDFHNVTLKPRLRKEQAGSKKRKLCEQHTQERKHPRVTSA